MQEFYHEFLLKHNGRISLARLSKLVEKLCGLVRVMSIEIWIYTCLWIYTLWIYSLSTLENTDEVMSIEIWIYTCLWIYTLWIYLLSTLENTDEDRIFFVRSPHHKHFGKAQHLLFEQFRDTSWTLLVNPSHTDKPREARVCG